MTEFYEAAASLETALNELAKVLDDCPHCRECEAALAAALEEIYELEGLLADMAGEE